MTTPPTAPVPDDTRLRQLVRPGIVLPVAAALLVVIALLTPERRDGRAGDARLTTYSHTAQGAALFRDLAQSFGWHTTQWTGADLPARDSSTVIAELYPSDEPSDADAHAILEHVRKGGALLYVINSSSLDDSLHLRQLTGSSYTVPRLAPGDRDSCSTTLDGAEALWPGFDEPLMNALRFKQGSVVPDSVVRFAWRALNDSTSSPVAMGFPFGRGRVVAIADPDMMRNDFLRVCHWRGDVVAMRELEYLAQGGRRTSILFDEYHQGYGLHPGSTAAVTVFLLETRPGRVLAQLLLACIVLVLATGARILPPREEVIPERRSPLEHVDALGRAYDSAAATRVATERLLHGVRRRAQRAAVAPRRAASDEEFLTGVAQRYPERAEDAALVARVLGRPATRQELTDAGDALGRIEDTLSTPAR